MMIKINSHIDIIRLSSETNVSEWLIKNNETLLNAVYNKLELFLENKLENEVLVRLIIESHKEHNNKKYAVENVVDIFLVKTAICEMVEGLLTHLIKNEEYEKCAILVKLKEKYEI